MVHAPSGGGGGLTDSAAPNAGCDGEEEEMRVEGGANAEIGLVENPTISKIIRTIKQKKLIFCHALFIIEKLRGDCCCCCWCA